MKEENRFLGKTVRKKTGKIPSSKNEHLSPVRENCGGGVGGIEALASGFHCNPFSTVVYIGSFQVRFCLSGELHTLKRKKKFENLRFKYISQMYTL